MSIPRLPPLPLPVQFAISLPPLALGGWWWFTYSGPYRWLAEWQIREWGKFYQILTFLVVVCVPLFLAALLIHLGCWVTGFHFDRQRTQESIDRWRAWHQQRRYRIGGLCVGLVVVVLGGQGLYVGKRAGPLSRMNVAELENGTQPTSGWLELRGNFLHGQMVTWKIERKDKIETYIPLVSDDWEPGSRVAVIVRAKRDTGYDPERRFVQEGAAVDGLVDPLGLPGHVRTTLEDAGVALVADPIVIDYRSTPEVQTLLGTVGLVLGGIVMLFSALVWLIKHDGLLPQKPASSGPAGAATFPDS
jgi:hypothetical protein